MSKYLIKIWSCGKADLIENLDWETDQNENSLINEIHSYLTGEKTWWQRFLFWKKEPMKGLRVTIERNDGRENEKPR